MSNLELFVCRHGEYENPQKIMPFRLPGFPLNDEGIRHAKAIAQILPSSIDTIYSSPILRCKQTAEIIGKFLGIPVKESKYLIETKSSLQGMSKTEFFKKGYGDFDSEKVLTPEDESVDTIFSRMNEFVTNIIDQDEAEQTVVVSHGDPIMSLIAGIVDKDLSDKHLNQMKYIPKGGLVKFVFKNKFLIDFEKLIF